MKSSISVRCAVGNDIESAVWDATVGAGEIIPFPEVLKRVAVRLAGSEEFAECLTLTEIRIASRAYDECVQSFNQP